MIYKYKYLIYFAVFILVFSLRYAFLRSPLPPAWKEGEKIRVEAVVKDVPYQSGTKYIMRVGRFFIKTRNNESLKLGERVAIIGTPTLQVMGKRIVRVDLIDPLILPIETDSRSRRSLWDKVAILLVRLRVRLVEVMRTYLPEPHASLATGILLGVKQEMNRDFYEALVETGTLHVVAASGYNVTVVMRVVMGVVMLFLSRAWGLIIGFGVVGGYLILAGGSPAVVRAGVMGILTFSAYFWGREAQARRLLWLTAVLMLWASPLLIWDVGFQLSFAATAGMLYLEPKLSRGLMVGESKVFAYLKENVVPTVAAGLATAPVVYYHFGRVSFMSPLVNGLVLAVVPSIMLMSAVLSVVGSVWSWGGWLVAMLLYIPLEFFVRVVELFGNW